MLKTSSGSSSKGEKMKMLLGTMMLLVGTLCWAGPLDDCYTDNSDHKAASLCAFKVLAKKIEKIESGSGGSSAEITDVRIYRESSCKGTPEHTVRLNSKLTRPEIQVRCDSFLSIYDIYYYSMSVEYSDGFVSCKNGTFARWSPETMKTCLTAI
jgi:hypothetical protein